LGLDGFCGDVGHSVVVCLCWFVLVCVVVLFCLFVCFVLVESSIR